MYSRYLEYENEMLKEKKRVMKDNPNINDIKAYYEYLKETIDEYKYKNKDQYKQIKLYFKEDFNLLDKLINEINEPNIKWREICLVFNFIRRNLFDKNIINIIKINRINKLEHILND